MTMSYSDTVLRFQYRLVRATILMLANSHYASSVNFHDFAIHQLETVHSPCVGDDEMLPIAITEAHNYRFYLRH